MKKIMPLMLSAALVASSMAIVIPTPAEAASKKYCRSYAKAKADKKSNKKAIRNVVVGTALGAGVGAILGGKRSTIFGAAGGAAVGIASSGGKWDRYYADAYAYCRAEL